MTFLMAFIYTLMGISGVLTVILTIWLTWDTIYQKNHYSTLCDFRKDLEERGFKIERFGRQLRGGAEVEGKPANLAIFSGPVFEVSLVDQSEKWYWNVDPSWNTRIFRIGPEPVEKVGLNRDELLDLLNEKVK